MMAASSTSEHVRLPVEAMTCQGCVKHVTEGLKAVAGVVEVRVDLAAGVADVEFAPESTRYEDLRQAVLDAGYGVGSSPARSEDPDSTAEPLPAAAPELVRADLAITGMTCAGCVATIERSVSSLLGVERCDVNLATRSAQVSFDGSATNVAAVIEAVRAAGYDARERGEQHTIDTSDDETAALLRRLQVSAVFTIPLLVIAMSHGLLDFSGSQWVQLALTVPVMVYGGGSFYRSAWAGVWHLRADMNTLVAVGTGAAFVYSLVATMRPEWITGHSHAPVYYETAAAIITLILLGRVLESRARSRTSGAIRKLLALQSATARVIRAGDEIEVLAEEVVAGDEVIVRPGESIPVDGTVLDGRSAVTEAALTGESVPVDKQPGDRVFAGTLNGTGSITFRAEGVGEDTALAKIIAFVERAQGTKAPIARLADRIAAYFVPTVLATAVVTFVVWYTLGEGDAALRMAIVNSVAVLIIACPCAMGLATPTAIMVGIGRGAELGILIKDGASLEAAQGVDMVVFDKTGTLTTGQFEVTDVALFGDVTSDEVLDAVAAVERRSEHPLAAALVAAGTGGRVAIEDFEALPGLGVQAHVNGQTWLVGKPALLASREIDCAPATEALEQFAHEGKTVVLVAKQGRIVSAIALADGVREDAKNAVQRLQERGVETSMITGDNQATAAAVAARVGIPNVIAGVMPDQKAVRISKLQSQGRTVAMVGDGINDAPALAQADVGIAIGAGTDIAIEAADMILVRNRPGDVVVALQLSNATMRTIRQNLFWAFAYNAVGIPIAAGLLYPWTGLLLSPILASGAMALSSVSVVTNSLRLRRARLATTVSE